MHFAVSNLLFLLLLVATAVGQFCPFFGGSQCPEGYHCVLDKCRDDNEIEAPADCSKIKCGKDAECRGDGLCVPFAGRLCGRNVLIAEGVARAIVSDCGPLGKCIGGRCSIDRCAEVLCDDATEICRDGMCMPLSSILCFSPYDCGPPSLFECQKNKCQRRADTIAPAFSNPAQRCDPGEIFNGEKCVTQEGCAQVVCSEAHSCYNGFCIPASGGSCSQSAECNEHSLCRAGTCVPNICKINGGTKCPPEHACSPVSTPEGECRPFQGILCTHSAAAEDCPVPYLCVGGVCTKDECHGKVCQIGERCDGGICIRVEGNACSNALKDCGEHFECEMGMCRDKIGVYADAEQQGAAGK